MLSTEETVNTLWDVIVVGGGPAGSIAALALAKKGRKVILIEKATFPRFHIGESFLPATFNRLCELGLEPALRELPHVPKFGAEFAMGNGGKILTIDFIDGYCETGDECFNIERSVFDAMLLREAGKAGVTVHQDCAVKQIVQLKDGDVRLATDIGELRGKYLLDASGQSTIVGRHLGTRQNADEPHLRKVAYFNQFEHVKRPPGKREGHPMIAMLEEGWFWMIPLNERTTSVGVVMDAAVAKGIQKEQNIAPDRMLRWAIERTPVVRERMVAATGSETNNVIADFSYRCRPYAGDGHFLIGDAAAFMDPIFSTGVSVALNGGLLAVNLVDDVLAGKTTPAKARRKYIALLEESTTTLFTLIRQYYDHSFRELFLEGQGPMQVHKAVIGVLAGNVFPRPPFKLRWRLKLFDFFVKWNRKRQLVPRRRRFSIAKASPATQLVVQEEAMAGSM
jgi:flavin-dependent dehydrogenase